MNNDDYFRQIQTLPQSWALSMAFFIFMIFACIVVWVLLGRYDRRRSLMLGRYDRRRR